mgnify:CR=1 FL=1
MNKDEQGVGQPLAHQHPSSPKSKNQEPIYRLNQRDLLVSVFSIFHVLVPKGFPLNMLIRNEREQPTVRTSTTPAHPSVTSSLLSQTRLPVGYL